MQVEPSSLAWKCRCRCEALESLVPPWWLSAMLANVRRLADSNLRENGAKLGKLGITAPKPFVRSSQENRLCGEVSHRLAGAEHDDSACHEEVGWMDGRNTVPTHQEPVYVVHNTHGKASERWVWRQGELSFPQVPCPISPHQGSQHLLAVQQEIHQ